MDIIIDGLPHPQAIKPGDSKLERMVEYASRMPQSGQFKNGIKTLSVAGEQFDGVLERIFLDKVAN